MFLNDSYISVSGNAASFIFWKQVDFLFFAYSMVFGWKPDTICKRIMKEVKITPWNWHTSSSVKQIVWEIELISSVAELGLKFVFVLVTDSAP